jgi:hypothetical protein
MLLASTKVIKKAPNLIGINSGAFIASLKIKLSLS